VVLFAGQLRTDKNPLLLVEAVNRLDFPICLLFAGQDKGAADQIRQANLHSQHRLIVEDRYLSLAELVAIMQLADVVACPYQVASQSGIVALAMQLGRPVVVSSAGGLSEQSSWSFQLGEDQSNQLADVLSEILAGQQAV
jgi:glycosyltransferase involved in cell wall biosynthesis